jgi:Xaa-Pro aminopeptidase
MTKKKLDAMLITDQANFHYYSGLSSSFWHSPTRPMYLLIPRVGDSPIATIPSISYDPMQNTWLDKQKIYSWAAPNLADDGRSLLL